MRHHAVKAIVSHTFNAESSYSFTTRRVNQPLDVDFASGFCVVFSEEQHVSSGRLLLPGRDASRRFDCVQYHIVADIMDGRHAPATSLEYMPRIATFALVQQRDNLAPEWYHVTASLRRAANDGSTQH